MFRGLERHTEAHRGSFGGVCVCVRAYTLVRVRACVRVGVCVALCGVFCLWVGSVGLSVCGRLCGSVWGLCAWGRVQGMGSGSVGTRAGCERLNGCYGHVTVYVGCVTVSSDFMKFIKRG